MQIKDKQTRDIANTSLCKSAIHTLFLLKPTLPPNSAIVFDIDDTLLDSITGKRMEDVLNIYSFAKVLKLYIILITARSDNNMIATDNQLKQNNISYTRLYFRKNKTNKKDITARDLYEYKLEARKDAMQRGYNIIMSVGDKPWDVGTYGGIGIKLED